MADIIQIDRIRLERIHKLNNCNHHNMSYDEIKEHVECRDCGQFITPFQAFMMVLRYHGKACQMLESRRDELQELENKADRNLLKATRLVDHAWRSKRMLPCCPHCGKAIAPEDGFGNGHSVSRELEMKRREQNTTTK